MQKIFKLEKENSWLYVDINSNKKVNLKLNDEEVNFFLGNPRFNDAEMEYMLNFLEHRLESTIALKIHKEIGVIVGHFSKKEATVNTISTDLFGQDTINVRTKRRYSKRKYNLKLFMVRIYDKENQCVYARANKFPTKMEANKFAINIIDEIKMGTKSGIEITKV
jgi:hypothetical protein